MFAPLEIKVSFPYYIHGIQPSGNGRTFFSIIPYLLTPFNKEVHLIED